MRALTIRLDAKLAKALEGLARRGGCTKSELTREALRRYVAVLRFRELRSQVLPRAKAEGLFSDEDVFRIVS